MTNMTRSQLLLATLSCAFTLVTGQVALADDTDIFFGQSAATNINNNPNVLLILDSSGSMNAAVAGDPLGRDRLEVVQDVANDFIANMNNVNIGLMKYDYRRGSYDARSEGGMIVHEIAPVDTNRPSLTNEVNKIVHYGATPLQETYLEAAYYWMGDPVLYGRYSREGYITSSGYYARRDRPSVGNSRLPGTWTYKSPITSACQRNYIVYLTDGQPTRDINGTSVIQSLLNDPDYTAHDARTCENPDGLTNGGECLDELAEFLHDNDFNDVLPGRQNVISNFIGFAIDLPFLERAAENGGGTYYKADNAVTLRNALTEIFNVVADDVNGFTAPAVTVNAFDRTTHLDQLFFTVFQPNDRYVWGGNVKKYRYVSNSDGDGLTIVGADGQSAVNPATGFFYDGRDPATGLEDPNVPKAWSYWSAAPDGASVAEGGAANELDVSRKVLTNASGNALSAVDRNNSSMRSYLTGRAVPFSTGSPLPVPAVANDAVVDRWLDWAAGLDAFDRNSNGLTNDARKTMGDPLHSKPVVVVYGGTSEAPETALFVGTNEGYLHAIDGQTGEEYFSFMPQELWENIPFIAENPKLGAQSRRYGVDGPITVWKNDGGDGTVSGSDTVYLYFGMRRGGKTLYAMNVTDPNQPTVMWKFDESDHAAMGQSWSPPVRSKVNLGTTDSPNIKDVLIFGGGYDPAQDSKITQSADGQGNAVFMVDATTGTLLWSASNSGATLVAGDMDYSIPAGVRPIDMDLDGVIDRMYAVDIAGQLWRFDIHNENSFEITGGVIAELGATVNNNAANNRRFFYAPDVALGRDQGQAFLTVTLASGHRAKPLGSTIEDYLIGVRDYKAFDLLGTETNDYDYGVTINDLTTMTSASTNSLSAGAEGWKYALTDAGEKSLARSRIFQNTAYFSTYKPGNAPASNPCAPAVGSGALYTIDLTTGLVARTQLQKPGIPPEATFIFGEPVDQEWTLDTCFGPQCDTDPNDVPEACAEGDPNCEPYEETRPNSRPIACVAGPEQCGGGSGESPVKTYWRQVDQSD